MSSPINRFSGRVALLAALTALVAAAFASAASAEVVPTPSTEIPRPESEIIVSGTTHPAGAEDVAIVVCNAEAETGERCDANSATPLEPVSLYSTEGIPVQARRGAWADFDFRMGVPPVPLESSTTCLSKALGGTQCEVVVSFYKTIGKAVIPVGAPQTAPITFK